MADVYQEQAQFFANVPLMQSGVVASVHLEDVDDKLFWDVMLQKQHPGRTDPLIICHTVPGTV